MIYDSIIIGCGAAGMTAALNLLRNGKKVLILEKEVIGGQISSALLIENYPAIKGISGMDFSMQLFEQISDLGAIFELEEVKEIQKLAGLFKIKTDYQEYEAYTVVIATGAQHRKLNIPGVKEFDGKGVSYCAVCDGAFFKDKDIAVIGGSDSALVYSLYLASIAKTLYLCMRRDTYSPGATKLLIDRLESKKNVKIIYNVISKEIKGNTSVTSLVLTDKLTNKELSIDLSAVFVAIGLEPKTDIFKEYVETEYAYILTDENMQTKTNGLYAVGDVRYKKVRQLTTAESDATIASYSIIEYLA